MSSRATRVESGAQPFDWHGVQAAAPAPAGFPAFAFQPAPEPVADPEPAVAVPESTEPMLPAARAAEMERAAFATGYAEGERAAAAAAASQAHAMLRSLTAAVADLSGTRQDMIRRTERQVVELAMAIARHVLRRELATDRGILLAMARVALDDLGEHMTASIRLHPDDYALIGAGSAPESGAGQITVVADSTVARGQCLVECAAGVMDVSIDSQFTELARTLIGDTAGDAAADRAR